MTKERDGLMSDWHVFCLFLNAKSIRADVSAQRAHEYSNSYSNDRRRGTMNLAREMSV